MNRFLSIGECMIEISHVGAGFYRRGFAGDTFNTAWYARKLLPPDWSVGYATCVGDDAASQEMLDFMIGHGIDTAPIRRVPGRTVGLYLISLTNGERSFSYWRSQSAARCLADDPVWLAGVMVGADIIHFSAITLAILSPDGRRALCDALQTARTNGAQVSFDTNLRPALWENETAMREGLLLGASVADVVLPSLDEERVLFGECSAQTAIERYAAQGAGQVVVKDGSAPATVWDNGEIHVIPAVQIARVIDTTAAGDSFAAGYLAARAKGLDAKCAALHASSLARKVIGAKGALVPEIFEQGTTA